MKAVFVVLQTILFLALFGAGSFLPAFRLMPMWSMQAGPSRIFVLDGVVLMLGVYVLFLAINAARGRLRHTAWVTSLAVALALAFGLAMKFGFVAA